MDLGIQSGGKKMESENLLSLEEFVRTMVGKRRHPIESLNSFMPWIKKQGCPKKWTFSTWLEKFEEFYYRKV